MNTFASFAIRFLSILFFIGLAGSAVVVVISFVEDFAELFSSNEVDPIVGHSPKP